MDGSGLSSLVSGFQQGYSFVDDIERKKKQDARLDRAEAREDRADARTEKEFSHKEKGWKKADDYEAGRMELVDKYFPVDKKDNSTPAPTAAAGIIPPSQDAAPQPSVVAPQAAGPAGVTPPTQSASPMASPAQMATSAAPSPIAGPAAIAQQGVPPAPAKPKKIDMNHNTDFLMEAALYDMKHGKLDGPGLLGLQKTVDNMKREKANEAIDLLHQGRYDEATDVFNSTGDHTGFKIISAKDAMFKAGKEEVPTKIVTVQDANGNQRVINTAESFYQRQPMEKVLAQAQKAREIEETGRHHIAEEKNQAVTAQSGRISALASAQNAATSAGSLKLQQESFKKQSLLGQVEQIESVTGPLKPEERKALGMQLAGFKTGDKGNQEYQKFVDNVVMEGVKAGTIKPEDAVKAQNRLMQGKQVMDAEATIASDLASSVGNPDAYAAKYAKAIQVAPPARLAEMGFNPPAQEGKAAKVARSIGIAPASPVSAPAAAPVADGVDVSRDPVLIGLQRRMSEINPNDPANANIVMAIGKAKNERIQQLQDSNGKMTRLTGIN